MRVVHETGNERRVLASEVETADGVLSQARGLMFRASIPDDYALVFRFGRAGRRRVHMLFVGFPLDVLWVRDGEVVQERSLRPWLGNGVATADTLLELPAGAAEDVAVGDRVVVEEA